MVEAMANLHRHVPSTPGLPAPASYQVSCANEWLILRT